MLIEMFVVTALIMGGAIGFSTKAQLDDSQAKPAPAVNPSKWSPEQHRDNMLQCRAICGKDLVKSYDSLTGGCECKG